MFRRPVLCSIMTIVHGKSERIVCENIRSNLKIKHEIDSEKKGRCSIQVNGLLKRLKKTPYKSKKIFESYYGDIDWNRFKLFIIMDVDDCECSTKKKFQNKELFKGHWLYEYIYPIFNDPNLEATMVDIGYEIIKKKEDIQIFPISSYKNINIELITEFSERLKGSKKTNLQEYIDYCIEICRIQHNI